MSHQPPFIADLHLHTCWSYDAEASVEQVFNAARRNKFKAIAITEHHCIDSIPAATAVARSFEDIRYIRAAEMTVTTAFGSVDLLCYGFPEKLPPAVQKVFAEYHEWQRRRANSVIQGIQQLGHKYSEQDHEALLRTYRPPETLAVQGRTHIQNQRQRAYFIERGFIKNEEEYGPLMAAAEKLVPAPHPQARYVADALKSVGVLISIAHPAGYFKGADEKRMDALREECRLDGIECMHWRTKPELTPLHRAYCVKHKMFSNGGSDSHTTDDHQKLMGKYGTPEEWWREVEERLPKHG
jgi:3',5'-nucleoside bisphosphate phosphatase